MSALITNERMFPYGVISSSSPDAPEEIVSLSKLHPHPDNYRGHPEDQLIHIRESIDDHGIYRNIVVANDYTILAGHGVYEAARQLGRTEIPVRRLPIASDSPAAARVIVLDNEMRLLATQKEDALEGLLRHMISDDPSNELNKLITRIGDEANIDLSGPKQITPPGEFPSVDETLETEHTCPQCGYEWSGGSK